MSKTLEQLQAANFIVPLSFAEREYWSKQNPFSSPQSANNDRRIAEIIAHVGELVDYRIDRGERYFNAYSQHRDLLEFRPQIVAHYKAKKIDISIRRGGFIFVFGGV